jgi:hypothetical protein
MKRVDRNRHLFMQDITHLNGWDIFTYRYLLTESPEEQLRNICDAKQNSPTLRLVSCHRLVQIIIGLTPASFSGGSGFKCVPESQ